ncbi:hypothetical protein CYLTODRAFT_71962 [Cylindrobasidium torrendii FP15055 ss-10]|uniref:Uncharacterized protein n=1 Tax=Cylindrobasidium torrendii FP15055 ss-10 TaxID=1314674 RepID=A0A0D7BPI4_9AGAR|nr:hypothetical protein CYLTODRAFT_71962 [Cylindrobasidium torrendii FP15055 ss-10]
MASLPIEAMLASVDGHTTHHTDPHTFSSSAPRIGSGEHNEELLFVGWHLLHDRSTHEGTLVRRSPNGGTPSGTIAAIVLGASLVLGLVAWLIFYFRVYRPRALLRPSVLPTTSPFASPSKTPAAVVNDPPVALHELPVIDISRHNRYSNTSDMARWKRVARGNEVLSGDLIFRHSNVQEEKDLPHIHGNTDTSSSHHRTSRWFGSDTQSLDVLPDDIARQRRSPASWGSSAKSYISRTASSINLGGTPTRPAHGRTSSSRPLLQEAAAVGQSFDDVEDDISLMDHPLTQLDSGERLGLADSSAALRALSSSRTGTGLPRLLYEIPPRLTDVEVPVRSPVIDVPATSPFRVDFASSEETPSPVDLKPKRRQIPSGVASALGHSESRRASTTSHVRFDMTEKEHSIHEPLPSDIAEDWAVASRLQAGPSSFHLTPPPTPYDSSFLDLSSSEESGTRSRPGSGQSEAHSEVRSSRSARISRETNESSHASRKLSHRLSQPSRASLPSLDIETSEDQMHKHPELEDFSPTTTMSSVRFSNGTMLQFTHGTQPPQTHPEPPLSIPPAALKRF